VARERVLFVLEAGHVVPRIFAVVRPAVAGSAGAFALIEGANGFGPPPVPFALFISWQENSGFPVAPSGCGLFASAPGVAIAANEPQVASRAMTLRILPP
jgi:hypothetical protein